jgi:hypothetical protein
LSALRADCPLPPPGRFIVLISVKRLSRLQSHSAAGRIRPIKKFNDLIGTRTRDLSACSNYATACLKNNINFKFILYYVRFEVFTAVTVKVVVFCNMKSG